MKVLIFDFDGTIIDSAVDLLTAINFSLRNNKCKETNLDFMKIHIGEPLEKVYAEILTEHNEMSSNGLISHLIEDFITFSRSNLVNNSTIFAGLEGFLASEKKQKQVIATTKPSFTAKKIAQLMNFEKYFDEIFGSEDIPPKPDPAIINNILRIYGIQPSEAIIIGDTDKDIMAGKSAGIKTCLAAWGYGDKQKAMACNPEIVAEKPEDLKQLI